MTRVTLTRTGFISHMRKGRSLEVMDEFGKTTLRKHVTRLGFYDDGSKRGTSLEAVFAHYGYYHINYGEAVVDGKLS